MGVGKSTVGPLVAVASSLAFIDLDQVITAHAGCAVSEIFAREAEVGFRVRERQALRSVLAGPPAVVALGGGALVDAGSRRFARSAATVITLTARLDTLRARLAESAGRPLLDADFATRLADRAAAYADADALIATDDRSPAEICACVIEAAT